MNVRKSFIGLYFLMIVLSSCMSEFNEDSNYNDFMTMDNEETLATRSVSNSIPIYTRLNNPYTLEVMQKIYNDYSIEPVTLEPTDLYVCFMPQDTSQFRVLMDNDELDLYDYPLDVVLDEGQEYVNPELGEDDLPWLYGTVKTDYVFPADIPYEIIETCYIPDDGESIAQARSTAIDVETIALGRSGFDVDTLNVLTKAPAKFPSGTIKVQRGDTLIPVKGVKIRCHNVVKCDSDYTDENGNYSIGKRYQSAVHYAIVFKNEKGFDLWGNLNPIGRANHNLGWHSNDGYSYEIMDSDYAWEWATVNESANDYYVMCENNSILTPPANLKIWVIRASGLSSCPMLRRINQVLGYNGHHDVLNSFINIIYGKLVTTLNQLLRLGLPDLTIGTKGKTFEDIYETVSHELSHASHFSKVGDSFWAKYISYIMTYMGYGDGTGRNAELCGIGEMWGYAMGCVSENELLNKQILVNEFPYPPIDGWIRPHVFWDLYASNTLTKKQIFDCLTPSNETYEELINEMVTRYPSKADSIRLVFARNGIVTEDVDVCGCPPMQTIEYKKPFEIAWAYSTDKTLCDIEFSFVKEKYFDGSLPANIYVDKDSFNKCSAYVTLKKPGYYIIEAKVKGTNIKKYFHVAKHYKPSFELPGSEMGEGWKPLTKLGKRVGDPYRITVTLDTTDTIQERLVALTMVNYRQMMANFDFRRIDVSLVYAGQDTLKINAGSPSNIELPELYNYIHEETVYDPVDSEVEDYPRYVTYTTKSYGYYTMKYPDDVCSWH